MTSVRFVTDRFAVASQLRPEDFELLKAEGVTTVVCNRPDGEEPGQATIAEMTEAAKAAGVNYVSIPFGGMPTPEQAQATREAIESSEGLAVAHCRSGTRSMRAWAMGQVQAGARSPDEVIQMAADAGTDLNGIRPALETAARG